VVVEYLEEQFGIEYDGKERKSVRRRWAERSWTTGRIWKVNPVDETCTYRLRTNSAVPATSEVRRPAGRPAGVDRKRNREPPLWTRTISGRVRCRQTRVLHRTPTAAR
jgi:hypothetical protein